MNEDEVIKVDELWSTSGVEKCWARWFDRSVPGAFRIIDEGSASIEKRFAIGNGVWWRSRLLWAERIFVSFFVAPSFVDDVIDDEDWERFDEQLDSLLSIVAFSSGTINFGVEQGQAEEEAMFLKKFLYNKFQVTMLCLLQKQTVSSTLDERASRFFKVRTIISCASENNQLGICCLFLTSSLNFSSSRKTSKKEVREEKIRFEHRINERKTTG